MSDDKSDGDFVNLLLAAMLDAAVEGVCCQLQTTITPPGQSAKLIRIIIVPEEMEFVRADPTGQFRRPL